MENKNFLSQITSLIAAVGLSIALLILVSEINEHAFPTPLHSDYVTASDSNSKEYKEQCKQYQKVIKEPETKRFYVRAGVGLLSLGISLFANSDMAIALITTGIVLIPYTLINYATESLPIYIRLFVLITFLLLLVCFFYRKQKGAKGR